MREIKFRCWDGEKMWYGHPHNDAFIAIHLFPRLKDFIPIKPKESAVLMQYTGLHDKNGKEIWEGDIVRDCSQHWDDYNTKLHDKTGFVKYLGDDIGMAEFEVVNDIDSIIVKSDCSNNWFPLSDSVEVIGNVWENPELLEDKAIV